MILYLVRHAQSEANANPKAYHQANQTISLTSAGEKHATQIGKQLADDIPCLERAGNGMALFTSPFRRCSQTSQLISEECYNVKIKPNILLSEINCGDQEGCQTEKFDERPQERSFYERFGSLRYTPQRGESLLDVYVRAGLFVTQQHFFQYIPTAIIVSHASTCLMLHHFLTNECPSFEISQYTPAEKYWPNGEIKKYEKTNGCFEERSFR